MKRRLCLFSSYYTDDELPYYIKYYLQQLRPHISYIVYITTNDKKFSSDDESWLANNVEQVMLVENGGYDFGMWQKSLRGMSVIDSYDELFLVNDSCICFDSLTPYFEWHDQQSVDVTGMTLSYDRHAHLQSFFLGIKKTALYDVVQFLLDLNLTQAKHTEVIELGELGLSKYLASKDYSINGFYGYDRAIDGLNPTYFHCWTLINIGIPLIKRKLLKDEYHIGVGQHLLKMTGQLDYKVLLSQIQSQTNHSQKMIGLLFKGIDLPKTPRNIYLKLRFHKFAKMCKVYYGSSQHRLQNYHEKIKPLLQISQESRNNDKGNRAITKSKIDSYLYIDNSPITPPFKLVKRLTRSVVKRVCHAYELKQLIKHLKSTKNGD